MKRCDVDMHRGHTLACRRVFYPLKRGNYLIYNNNHNERKILYI
jgi:hypothetical protein